MEGKEWVWESGVLVRKTLKRGEWKFIIEKKKRVRRKETKSL